MILDVLRLIIKREVLNFPCEWCRCSIVLHATSFPETLEQSLNICPVVQLAHINSFGVKKFDFLDGLTLEHERSRDARLIDDDGKIALDDSFLVSSSIHFEYLPFLYDTIIPYFKKNVKK